MTTRKPQRLLDVKGDTFDLSGIIAITRDEEIIYIYTISDHEFEYDFEDEGKAEFAQGSMVEKWRAYLNGGDDEGEQEST